MIVVLLNFLLVQGHVRMFYDSGIAGSTARPIRNAPNPEANGGFSVNGPCGGGSTWGGSGESQQSTANPGDKVTMKINYNGGHRSNANEFKVRFECGTETNGPTQEEMKSAPDRPSGFCNVLSCPTPNAYPCPAANGNAFTEGYIFECTIPSTAAGKQCTYSVLDQRDWGGCVDVQVLDEQAPTGTGAPEPTQPSVPQQTPEVVFPSSNAGTFQFYSADVDTGSPKYPNCCCTMDEGTASKNRFSVSDTGVLSGTVNLQCPAPVERYRGITSGQTELNEQLVYKGNNNWEGVVMISGQQMTFNLISDVLYYSNTDLGDPMICDGFISQTGTGSGVFTADTECGYMALTEELNAWNGVSSFSLVLLVALLFASL